MSAGETSSEAHMKIGSCSACRKARSRCNREETPRGTPLRCVRCQARNERCEYPSYRAGRKPGSVNKRPRLDPLDSSELLGFSVDPYATHSTEQSRSSTLLTSSRTSTRQGSPPLLGTNPMRFIQEIDLSEKTGSGAPKVDFFDLPKSVLDIGPDKDPIELGLLSKEESVRLMEFARVQLVPLQFALEYEWYTPERIRSRSSLLFTSLLAQAASFSEGEAAMSIRLNAHVRRLVTLIFNGHFRSIEIVLALLIFLKWCPAPQNEVDDPTTRLLSLSLNMGLGLQMDRVICDPGSTETFKGKVLEVDQVMAIDAVDQSTMSDLDVLKHLRARQRIFLYIFVHDPAINLVRGRPPSLPIGSLVDSCDRWHLHPAAITADYSLVAASVLIRDKETLLHDLRHLVLGADGADADKTIALMIENYFSAWKEKWRDPLLAATTDGTAMDPILQELASVHRLSIYTNVIADRDKRDLQSPALMSGAIDAAITVMSLPLRYEEYMATSSNTTWAFVAFASAFVLKSKASGITMSPASQALIPSMPESALTLLERRSTTPRHRNGIARHYAYQVRSHLLPDQVGERPGILEHVGLDAFPTGQSARSTSDPWRAPTRPSNSAVGSAGPPFRSESSHALDPSQSLQPFIGPILAESLAGAEDIVWLDWVGQVDPNPPS